MVAGACFFFVSVLSCSFVRLSPLVSLALFLLAVALSLPDLGSSSDIAVRPVPCIPMRCTPGPLRGSC